MSEEPELSHDQLERIYKQVMAREEPTAGLWRIQDRGNVEHLRPVNSSGGTRTWERTKSTGDWKLVDGA